MTGKARGKDEEVEEENKCTFKVKGTVVVSKYRRPKRTQQSRPDVDYRRLAAVFASSTRWRHTLLLLLQQEDFGEHSECVWMDGERPIVGARRVDPQVAQQALL